MFARMHRAGHLRGISSLHILNERSLVVFPPTKIGFNDDTVVPFTVICYHTTNRIFQLLGPKTAPKVNGLTVFVNQIIRKNVENVERTKLFRELQTSMKSELEELLTTDEPDKSVKLIGVGESAMVNILARNAYLCPIPEIC